VEYVRSSALHNTLCTAFENRKNWLMNPLTRMSMTMSEGGGYESTNDPPPFLPSFYPGGHSKTWGHQMRSRQQMPRR